LDVFERRLRKNEFNTREQKLTALFSTLGFDKADQIFTTRNWQETNELLLEAFKGAYKICYGDSGGGIDSYATPAYVQYDEIQTLMPYRLFSYGGNAVVDPRSLPLRIVPRQYLLRVFERYLQISPEAEHLRQYFGEN
jgi:hypothetical protein